MKPKLKLFFCHGNDGNGDNLDWFVTASTKKEARKVWLKSLDGTKPEGTRIFEVPAVGNKPMTHDWWPSSRESTR